MARAIDADELQELCNRRIQDTWNSGTAPVSWAAAYADFKDDIDSMPTLTPPNEPLTWNELGNMVEKPVYIVELEDGESCWVLVHTADDIKALFVSAFDQYDYGNRELYGQTWLAYRCPPEGEA